MHILYTRRGWKNPYISDNATISLQAKLHT